MSVILGRPREQNKALPISLDSQIGAAEWGWEEDKNSVISGIFPRSLYHPSVHVIPTYFLLLLVLLPWACSSGADVQAAQLQ